MVEKSEIQKNIQSSLNASEVDEEINNNINNDVLRKTINVKTMVKKENKLEIEELLKERQSKIKLLNYINVLQIFLLLVGACFWFLTSSFKESTTVHDIFWMTSGMCNVLFLWLESFKKSIYKQLNNIKTIILKYDDTNWKNELLDIADY